MSKLQVGQEIHKSIRWNILSTISKGLSSFVSVVLLARWVAPEYFGETAIATSLITFLMLVGQFGFSSAIISAKITDKKTVDSIFWSSMGLGSLIYAALFILAPGLESFYGIVHLSNYVRVSGLSILIVTASSIFTAVLIRDLKYSTQGVQAVVSALTIVATTLFMGWYESGPWTLLIPPMAGFAANLMVSVIQTRGLYRPRLQIDTTALKSVMRFGSAALWSDLMNYVCTNLHVLVMGRRWVTHDLGQYSMAYYRHSKISELVTYQYTGALYTILAEVRDDKNRMMAVFTRMSDLGLRIIGPLYGIAILLMDDLVRLILGEVWMPAVPLLRWFCLIPIFRTLNWGSNPVLYALGLPDLSARIATYKASSFVLGVGAAWFLDGSIYDMAIVTTVIESVFYAIYGLIALKMLGGSIAEFFRSLLPALGATVGVCGAVAVTRFVADGWYAIGVSVFIVIIYLALNRKRFSVTGLA